IALIQQEKNLKLNEIYEVKKIPGHFYPITQIDKCIGEISLANESSNPFDETPTEVEILLELYRTNVIEKYKGEKDIELRSNICTIEDFCYELNKVYGRTSSKHGSKLRPILTGFAKRADVGDFIGIKKNIYQLVDKEYHVINERNGTYSTQDNIHYFQSQPTIARVEPIPLNSDELTAPIVPSQRQVAVRPNEAHGNPFLASEPKIDPLINLYNEKVVNAYKGKKDIT
ncbi:TPA: MFS transporter permease, partial [Yersinia enterocolitica]|nr:MFS transporter permease [Yersinia enterocolitica]